MRFRPTTRSIVRSIAETSSVTKDVTRLTIVGLSATLFTTMMLFSTSASAECACFCVNGGLKTLCTTVEEAQDQPTLCSAFAPRACPAGSGEHTGASYDAPEDGAINCRDIRVFDALGGVFRDVKACDVLSAS